MSEHELTFHSKNVGVRTELGYGELDIAGNEEHGFRPFQLMISSIVGCSTGVYQKILEKQRIQYEEMQIDVKVERNPDVANRIEKIKMHFIVKGQNLKVDKLYKSLEVARKNCAMVQSVKDSIEIEETVEAIDLSM